MPGKKFTPEEIIRKLREVEVLQGQGMKTDEALRKIEVSRNTYCRWKKEYGGMRVDQAKKLKELEKENSRLKRLVADQALDIQMLKEVASKKF